MSRRYGFFLNVRPGERAIGIDQRPYLREAMLAAAAEPEIELFVAAPSWFRPQLREWLARNGLSERASGIFAARRLSTRIQLVDFLRRISEGTAWRDAAQRGRLIARSVAAAVGGRRNLLLMMAIASALGIVAIGCLVAWLAGPVAAGATAVVLAILGGLLIRARGRLVGFARKVLTFSRSERVRAAYRKLVDDHLDALVTAANRKPVDAWFVVEPYAFGERKLDAATVTQVPNLLPLEDPLGHAHPFHREQHLRVLSMLDRCAGIICHDEAVKENHLVYGAGLPRERISVIPSGRSDAPDTLGGPSAKAEMRTLRAMQIVRPFQRAVLGGTLGHAKADLGRDPFIIYAGDNAPHHHCLVLLRALKRYLRQDQAPIRLVMRKHLLALPMVEQWLVNEAPELAPYVIGVEDETPLNWLALTTLARCAVDPSLFAPDFPGTFSQALCVETPILMSAIPAVETVITDAELRRDMLFDPYDAASLLERLNWALLNREDLVARQSAVFERLPTWQQAGRNVLETLEAAASKKDVR